VRDVTYTRLLRMELRYYRADGMLKMHDRKMPDGYMLPVLHIFRPLFSALVADFSVRAARHCVQRRLRPP